MNTHNELIKFLDNITSKTVKKFKSKIFKKKDYEDFLYFGAYLLKEAKKLYDEKIEPYRNPEQFRKLRYKAIKQNAFLGLGSEYFLKSIFLKKGYAVNKLLRRERLMPPYKVYGNVRKLDPEESVPFAYIKNNIHNIINFRKFDEGIRRLNENLDEENSRVSLRRIRKINYKKMNSNEILIYLWGLRNNTLHNAYIKTEFRGIFKDIYDFLNFLSKKEYKKEFKDL